MRPDTDTLDVAVVGGGAAGLYSAWRIAAERPDARVAVFEASDRIGGRLFTVTPEGTRALRAELGGIAVISTHALVVETTDALGLEREPLAGGDPHNLLYLRGRRFRAEQWGDPETVPYSLSEGESGRSPERIFAAAVEELVPDAATLTPREWDEVKRTLRTDGGALADTGLWNLLRDRLSSDAFRMLSDAGGFRPEFQNWNAAEALVDMSSGWPAEARYERLADGYEALPRALAGRLEEGGGEVALGHRLRRIRTGAPDGPLELELDVGGSGRIVAARSAILALPQHALQLLAPSTPLAGSDQFGHDLRTVATVPLVHLFLAYEEPWWEQLGIRSGRSATDLPIQSCFYFGTEGELAGGDPDSRLSLAMVGYSSAEAVEFWDAYLGGHAEPAEPHPAAPPPAMLSEVTRQLSELHGIDVPDPYWTRLMDWRSELYGAASHRWRVGARSWEVVPRMRRPLPEVPIHVCGEAWSDLQGWTEGALRSAERVLRDELGLDRPQWMSADPYLGP